MIYDVSHGDRCHLINGAVLELQVGAKLCALSNGLSVMFYYCLLCTQEGSPYVLLLSVMYTGRKPLCSITVCYVMYAGSPQWSNAGIFPFPDHHGVPCVSSRTGNYSV